MLSASRTAAAHHSRASSSSSLLGGRLHNKLHAALQQAVPVPPSSDGPHHPQQQQQSAALSTLALLHRPPPRTAAVLSSLPSIAIDGTDEQNNDDLCTLAPGTPLANRSLHRLTQTRHMPRKGGASAFATPRPPTRKQRLKYHRRQREQYQKTVGKHSPPGSKAAVRREFVESRWQDLLDQAEGKIPDTPSPEDLEYDYGDAVLDDLIGNSSDLSSSIDPRPTYMGHKHTHFLGKVKGMMDEYKLYYDAIKDTNEETSSPYAIAPPLPSDHTTSLLLRSYRDSTPNVTKNRPIGLAKALRHLFQEVGVPSSTFGEFTYTTLLTCCATPTEARRVFKMMEQVQHPISDISFSILIDLHSRRGDVVGAASVMEEMSSQHSLVPPLTAYTSFLAGCYRVCNAGAAPPHIKAHAGRLGWEKWKEMRIVGLEPDVMAYGAIVRLLAARGQPERAISTLEEMDVMGVRPTTLVFAGALRAVSRSHANALRFAGGKSKKNKRRERITAHHGRMARAIVIKAESAEVRQDDGFVSALMMCAAVSGDVATAKAVYLAHRVRRMRHLRTIGGDGHLRQLRGELRRDDGGRRHRDDDDGDDGIFGIEEQQQLGSSDAIGESVPSGSASTSTTKVMVLNDEEAGGPSRLPQDQDQNSRDAPSFHRRRHPNWKEREYGRDTRRLSALLTACANAMEPNGLGNMWAGRDNLGYLDETSLRSIETRPRPKYRDTSIPGLTSLEAGISPMMWEEEQDVDKMSKRLRRAKFRGIEQDDDVATTIDDLDEDLYNDAVSLLTADERAARGLERGDDDDDDDDAFLPGDDAAVDEAIAEIEGGGPQSSGVYFDAASGTIRPRADDYDDDGDGDPNLFDNDESTAVSNDMASEAGEDGAVEYVDEGNDGIEEMDEMAFFKSVDDDLKSELESGNFDSFYATLKEEIEESGEDEVVDEDEARELFELMQHSQRSALEGSDGSKQGLGAIDDEEDEDGEEFSSSEDFDKLLAEYEKEARGNDDGNTTKDKAATTDTLKTSNDELEADFAKMFPDFFEDVDSNDTKMHALADEGGVETESGNVQLERSSGPRQEMPLAERFMDPSQENDTLAADNAFDRFVADNAPLAVPSNAETSVDVDYAAAEQQVFSVNSRDESSRHIAAGSKVDGVELELQEALPGLPQKRIKQLKKAFLQTLGDPSLLRLVPILRENMPPYMTTGWLKRKNLENARVVMAKAEEDGLVDIHMLNSMLQVETSSGSLDRAIGFHEDEYARKKLKPTPYSDRLVLQMLVKNNRLPRALAFKDKVENQGRTLDMLSYGSLVEYYGNHDQLGSALMMLKECIATHGSPPGEKSLGKIRLVCRKRGLEKEVGLAEMIGDDPLEWLRHGEEFLKRESSYKGRRDVNLPGNRLLQI